MFFAYGPAPKQAPPAGSPLDAVRLYKLSQNDATFQFYKTTFESSWAHPGKTAQFQGVYSIVPAPGSTDRSIRSFAHCYPAYMGHRFQEFLRNMDEVTADEGTDEPKYRFHGTKRACNIGDQDPGGGYLRTCQNHECSLCKILRNSFTLSSSGSNAGSMFGHGIYSTTCSSKADHYVRNHHVRSNLHAMLVCAVVTGTGTSLACSDTTFDQIGGLIYGSAEAVTAANGGQVRYPETISYRENGIIPVGLVMYTRQGWTG